MKGLARILGDDKPSFYEYMNIQLEKLVSKEPDWLANLANSAALLFFLMEDINWAGFYIIREDELVLGPFQGKPACTHIRKGKGVCGTYVVKMETQVIPDIRKFPGHITCDEASLSEIVIPIIVDGKVCGVLDIDSPITGRFDYKDAAGLERFVSILLTFIDWHKVS